MPTEAALPLSKLRLPKEQLDCFRETILKLRTKADVYLFGSRTNPEARGGDIDILVIDDEELTFDEKSTIRITFMKRFGEQKLDIVSFSRDADTPFKRIALSSAVQLN